jgi:tetratricopeptide (TPR) repeat protein
MGRATILNQRDDLVAAAAVYQEAEEVARRLSDDECLSSCSERLDEIRRRVDNLDRALELHRRHNWDWRASGDPSVLSASLANQGVTLATAGKHTEALAVLERLEQVCRERPSFPGLAIALGHQAEIHAACGDHARAETLYQEQKRLQAYTAEDFPIPERVINSDPVPGDASVIKLTLRGNNAWFTVSCCEPNTRGLGLQENERLDLAVAVTPGATASKSERLLHIEPPGGVGDEFFFHPYLLEVSEANVLALTAAGLELPGLPQRASTMAVF